MSREVFMLDTNICSFLIRKRPDYLLDKLQQTVVSGHQLVVSAITDVSRFMVRSYCATA